MKERLLDFVGERSLRAVATRSGIEPSKLHRQVANELKVQTVVQICRAYDAPMLTAFALAGFITEQEGDSLSIEAALGRASTRQLAEELLRRAVKDDTAAPGDDDAYRSEQTIARAAFTPEPEPLPAPSGRTFPLADAFLAAVTTVRDPSPAVSDDRAMIETPDDGGSPTGDSQQPGAPKERQRRWRFRTPKTTRSGS